MATKITYNSKTTEVANGKIATLSCNGKKMQSDIVVEVPIATDSSLPFIVGTENEMTALLESGEVGGVYKYTGTTGTYENGALYVLEEEAVSTITFTIEGTSYTAEDGMTWGEWCDSDYNTTSFAVSGTYVKNGNGMYIVDVELFATFDDRVLASDSITSSFAYYATGAFEPA